MLLLSDNDIIHKLAAFDLFDEALVALGVTVADVRVLPTAKYKFGIGTPRGEKRFGANLLGKIAAILGRVREIDSVTSVPPELSGIAAIDQGEAILFTAARAERDAIFATGDKRSLKALVAAPTCSPVAEAIRGRVLCLESIVLRMIERHGFELVRSRIVAASAVDKAMDVVFGSGLATTEASARDALASYLRELRSLPVDLLAPDRGE